MMNKTWKAIFIGYYSVILLLALSSIDSILNGQMNLYDLYNALSSPSPHVVFLLILPIIVLILSIASIIVVIQKNFSKFLLVYPIYFLVYMTIWLTVIPAYIGYRFPLQDYFIILDSKARFDFIFYLFDIAFSVLAIIIISKFKESNLKKSKHIRARMKSK